MSKAFIFAAALLCLSLSVVLCQNTNYTLTKQDAVLYQADVIEMEAHKERRIVGGRGVSNAEWRLTRPWEVQNVCDFSDGKGWVPCGCSSTIINNHYLITAGHCLNCPYEAPKRVGLRFSDGHVDDQPWQEIHAPGWQFGDNAGKQRCGIRSVLHNDVGLQYLAKPIRFRYGVSPFPGLLDKKPNSNCNAGIVSGWGATTEQGGQFANPVYSNQLNKLRETVYPNAQCQAKIAFWFYVLEQAIGTNPYCTDPLDADLICASPKDLNTIAFSTDPATFGYPIDPKGICNGDSGSPLFDPVSYSVLGFVSDTLSTNPVGPCGYGIDIFTKFTDELKDWAKKQLSVDRPRHWKCPNAQ